MIDDGYGTLNKFFELITDELNLKKIKDMLNKESKIIEKDFRKYPNYLKDLMKLKNIMYISLENNFFDYEQFKNKKYCVPSDNIKELTNNIFKSISFNLSKLSDLNNS